MTRQNLVLLASLGSLGLLSMAFGFQYLGGLAPCKMCLWQRWPHAVAIIVGAIAVSPFLLRFAPFIGALAAATTGGIGVYHAGVEQGWWEGPSTCTGNGADDLSAMSGADMLSTEDAPSLIMCDQIVWDFLGLSMAGWNAVVSFGLLAIWLLAMRKPVPQV
jgi:disulfide bond formation protein DsbB